MPEISAELALVNRVQLLFGAATMPTRNWMYFLANKDYDDHPDARRRIFAIYMCALLDAAEGGFDRVVELKRQAERLNQPGALYYLRAANIHIGGILDLLEQFHLPDLIFLSELRHQYVHGLWSEYPKQTRMARHIKAHRVQREKLTSDDYWGHFRSVSLDLGRSFDDTFDFFRSRLYRYKTPFWHIDDLLGSNERQNLIYNDMRRHGNWSEPAAVIMAFNKHTSFNAARADGTLPHTNVFDIHAASTPGAEPDPVISQDQPPS